MKYRIEFKDSHKAWFEDIWPAFNYLFSNIDISVTDSPSYSMPIVKLYRGRKLLVETVRLKWDWYCYRLEVKTGLTKEEYGAILSILECHYFNSKGWNNTAGKFNDTPKAVFEWDEALRSNTKIGAK